MVTQYRSLATARAKTIQTPNTAQLYIFGIRLMLSYMTIARRMARAASP